jgi:hypothetical protein
MAEWKKKSFDLSGSAVSEDKYTDMAICNSLKVIPESITNGKISDGLIGLVVSVDQLERICRARKLIAPNESDDEYFKKVKVFTEKLTEPDKSLKDALLANYKLELLMERAFSSGIKDEELDV